MATLRHRGFPVIGALFLLMAAIKLIQGESWVVWFLLSLPFGALRLFSARKPERTDA